MPKCHCGRALHYDDKKHERWVNQLIKERGEFVVVEGVDGRLWKVPRHYLALHGVMLIELPTLGFEEVDI